MHVTCTVLEHGSVARKPGLTEAPQLCGPRPADHPFLLDVMEAGPIVLHGVAAGAALLAGAVVGASIVDS